MSQIGRLEARAGFWGRYVAFFIDVFIVWLLAAILVGIPVGLLFAASNGAIQFGPTERTSGGAPVFEAGSQFKSAGFNLIRCANVDLAQLPEGLDPAPPAQATFALDCRNFAFGLLETARGLTVGRVAKEGTTTETLTRSYALGADGKPRKAVSLDWLPPLLFFIYLVTFQCRFGATLGMQPLHTRVVDVEAPGRGGIPLRKAIIRNLLLWAGVVAFYENWEAMFSDSFTTWLFVADVLIAAYVLWILVDIVRKQDPIYDRIAGTAVLRSPG
ncbi:RDD family protein [Rhizobiales bacterium GAS188]|nr:RDD family protein [Rhizobiales bacterium GAS188]